MALAQILFSARQSKTIASIEIDVYEKEGHQFTAQTTDVQVEDGSKITDQVVQLSDILDLSCVIGPNKLGSNDEDPTRVLDKFNALEAVKLKGEPITIVTGLKVYDNIVILSLNVTRTSANGKSLEFTLTGKQIRRVKSQSVLIPKTQLGGTGQRQAQGQASTGQTATKPQTQSDILNQIRKDLGVPTK